MDDTSLREAAPRTRVNLPSTPKKEEEMDKLVRSQRFPEPGGPVVEIIMDGVGVAPEGPGNAVVEARTPTLDWLVANNPNTLVAAQARSHIDRTELDRRQIDRHAQRRQPGAAPGGDLTTGGMQYPITHLLHESHVLQHWKKSPSRQGSGHRMPPAQQGL